MRRYKKLISYLLLVLTINIYLMYNTLNNKDSPIGEIHLKDSINKLDSFAIMLEQNDGTYVESTSSTFPINYTLNLEKSKCIDKDGNILNNALSITKDIVEVKTTTTTYCYLYFDKIITAPGTIFEGVENISSELLGDMYRFVGTANEVDNNYICFGTADKDTCINNKDKYMYRIIGVNTNGDIKLIKKEALSIEYSWTNFEYTDINWNESELYNGLNGSYFLSNTTYSYMQDSTWTNKIADWDYIATNTKTYESSGLNYYNEIAKNVYLHEMNKNDKTNSVGEWMIVNSKIGLMYVSDYLLSLGSNTLNYSSNMDYEILKTSWLHINNSGSNNSGKIEWTMSRYGTNSEDDDLYGAWGIYFDGSIVDHRVDDAYLVRPTLYLKSNVSLESGKGTIDNPYIIYKEQTDTERLIENLSGDVLWNSTLEDDGYRFVGTDPNNYVCFGTTDKTTCTSDTDKYMYRIIGVFEDETGNQHLKLIKKEALNETYAWHEDAENDVAWNASELHNGINGSYFLSNTTYSYMQDSAWTNKIAIWNYTSANTKTFEKYSTNSVYGLYYWYNPTKTVYLHEMNRSSKTNQTCFYVVDDFLSVVVTADCSIGEWKTVGSKIGLMYVSDYLLSLGSLSLEYTSDNYEILKTGWLHVSNNDSGAPSQQEWTMTRIGDLNGGYGAYDVSSDGYIVDTGVDNTLSVRPVFYLTSDVELSGDGTIESPYVIK